MVYISKLFNFFYLFYRNILSLHFDMKFPIAEDLHSKVSKLYNFSFEDSTPLSLNIVTLSILIDYKTTFRKLYI